MNTLTFRTLSTFPAELQSYALAHAYDDFDELVQQVALALLEAKSGDTLRAIFNRARSACRRYTQDLAYYGRGLDGIADPATDDKPDDEPPSGGGRKRRELTREIAADRGVTARRARQIVAEQVQRAKRGDLFAGYESGVAA